MMWLPQQTQEQWQESVESLIEVGPEHASLYLLELYPNAPLKEDMARSGWSLAPDDDAAEMYLWSMDRLDRAGYRQYEISNVARAGREARHNLKYWHDGEWLGFGCGAHSTAPASDGRTSRPPRSTSRGLATAPRSGSKSAGCRRVSKQRRRFSPGFGWPRESSYLQYLTDMRSMSGRGTARRSRHF